MAWHDRDYNRDGGSLSTGMAGKSVVTWLIIINVVIALLDGILTGSTRGSAFSPSEWGYYSVEKAIYHGQVWRLVTCQFIHAGFFHLFFNMLSLFYFGPIMENWWGSRRFLAFYLLCGVGAALVYTALSFIPGLIHPVEVAPFADRIGLVGASGCIFGVLIGAARVAPTQTIMLLFPPIPMQLRTMAMVFLGIAVVSVIAGSMNAGGEAAHLGGAVVGFLFMKYPGLLGFADRFSGSVGRWKQGRLRAVAEKERQQAAKDDAEVDRILVKVKEHGLHSLTDKEKKTLQRATDRQRRVG
jgi:membrane associated rhomboid family serine protease